MSKEFPRPIPAESAPRFDIHTVTTPEDLEEFFAFADELIGVDWGEAGPPETYTPEYVAAHPDLTQVFAIEDAEGAIIATGKVTVLNDEQKARLGFDTGAFEGQKGALLEYTAVAEAHRNNRLLAALTEQRIAWAREQGASFVCSEAEITNPVSIYTKIRDGFVLTGIKPPFEEIPHPYVVEVKGIAPHQDEAATARTTPVWKEAVVTEDSFEELQALFADGWVGVDIKGAAEDPEHLGMPWTLILEKR